MDSSGKSITQTTMPTSTVTYSLPNAVSTGGSYKSTIVHNKIPISSDSQLIFQPQNGYTTYNRYDRDDRDGGASTVSSVTLPFSVGGSKVLYPNSQKNPGYASSKASTTSELDGYPTSPSPSIADSNLSFTSRGSGNRSFRRSHATIYGINETKTRSKIDLTVASEIGLPGEEIRKLPLELEEQTDSPQDLPWEQGVSPLTRGLVPKDGLRGLNEDFTTKISKDHVLFPCGVYMFGRFQVIRRSSSASSSSSRGVQKMTIKMLLTEKKSSGESSVGGESPIISTKQVSADVAQFTTSPPTSSNGTWTTSSVYHSQLLPAKLAEGELHRRAFSYNNRFSRTTEKPKLSASEVELCRPEYLQMSESTRVPLYERRPQSTSSRVFAHNGQEHEAFATKAVPYRSYERLDIENEDGGRVMREVIEELKDNVVNVQVHEKGDGLSKDRLAQIQKDEQTDLEAVDGNIGKVMVMTSENGTLTLPSKPPSPPRSRREKYELHQAMSWKRDIELRPSVNDLSSRGTPVSVVGDGEVVESELRLPVESHEVPVNLREETRVAETRAVSAPERYQPVTRVWYPEKRPISPVQTSIISSTMSTRTENYHHVQYRSIFDKNFTDERIHELRKSANDLRALADGMFDSSRTDHITPNPLSGYNNTSSVKYDYTSSTNSANSSIRRPVPTYPRSTERAPYNTTSGSSFSYKFNAPPVASTSTTPEHYRYPSTESAKNDHDNGYRSSYRPTEPLGGHYHSSPSEPTTNGYKSSDRTSEPVPSRYTNGYHPVNQPKTTLINGYSGTNHQVRPSTSSGFRSTQHAPDPTATPFKCSYPPSERYQPNTETSYRSSQPPVAPPRTASSRFDPASSDNRKSHVEETISKTTTISGETYRLPERVPVQKDPQYKYITQYKSSPTLPTASRSSVPFASISREPLLKKSEEPRNDKNKESFSYKSRDEGAKNESTTNRPRDPVTVDYSYRPSAFKPVEKAFEKPIEKPDTEPRSTGSSWAYGYKLPDESYLKSSALPPRTEYSGSLPREPPRKPVEPAIIESLRTKKPSPPGSPDIRPKDWVPPCKAKILQAKRKYMSHQPPPAPPTRVDPWEKYRSGSREKIQLSISRESLEAINKEASRGQRSNRYSAPDLRGSHRLSTDPAVTRSKINWPEREIQQKLSESQEYLSRRYQADYSDKPTTSSFANRWDARSRSLPPMSRYSKSAANTPIESPYPEYIDSDKAKSMEFLADVKKYDYRLVPENQLQRENISGYSRSRPTDQNDDNPYSEQVRKSLQKLDLPDWYVNSPYSQPGVMEGTILRHRAHSTTDSNYSPYTTLDRSELTSPTGTLQSSDAVVLSRRILPESYQTNGSKKNLSASREEKVWDLYTGPFYNKKSRPAPIYSPASESHRPYNPHDSGWSSDWNSHHESSQDSDESNTDSRNSPRTWARNSSGHSKHNDVAPQTSAPSSDWYKPPLGDRRRDRSKPARGTSSHHPNAETYSSRTTEVASTRAEPPSLSRFSQPSTFFDPALSQQRIIQSTPWEITSVQTETFKNERLAKKTFVTETNDPVKIEKFGNDSSQWGSYV